MTAEVVFRDAVATDVAAIVALVESAYRGEASRAGWTTEADLLDGQRTDAAAVQALIEAPHSCVLLAQVVAGGPPQACCHLARADEAQAYFGMFAVRPDQQGSGMGSAMLAEAERRARADWACTTMAMTVIDLRSELIAWYQRRGYRRSGIYKAFPYGDERFGLPRRPDLRFEVLTKPLTEAGS